MGTSGSGKGSPPTAPLIPTWINDAPVGPLLPFTPPAPPAAPLPSAPSAAPRPLPPIPDPPPGQRFRSPRTQFTRFINGGDSSNLGKALAGYVSGGTGGARRAAQRMAPSRRAASGVVQFFRDVEQRGVADALRIRNLDALVDRPTAEVFLQLVDLFCPQGGPIDEAIARDAMIETIAEFSSTTDQIAPMSPDQLKEFMIDFVSRSIEARVTHEVGTHMISLPDDVAAVQNIATQLHDFVSRCVTDAFETPNKPIGQYTDREITTMIDQLYEAALSIVISEGEAS